MVPSLYLGTNTSTRNRQNVLLFETVNPARALLVPTVLVHYCSSSY